MVEVWGLTGPSGSGKTTAARLLRHYGCTVLDCDEIARGVTDADLHCKKALCEAFGYDILWQNGRLNRGLLAQRAFRNRANTQRLNAVVAPYILKEVRERMRREMQLGEGVLVLDAPTLIESGLYKDCDCVIVVTAPAPLRLERIMKRDGITRQQALLRMQAQPPDSFYAQYADVLLDGAGEDFLAQIADLTGGGGCSEENLQEN